MKSSLAAILAAAVLFATNPTPQAYSTWLKQEALRTQSGDSVGSLLVGLFAEPLIQATTRQENFGLFSIYRTSVASTDDVVALGGLSHFMLLPKPTASSPTYPHVISAGAGQLKPEDGYVWTRQPPNGDFHVRWVAGRPMSAYPHVFSGAQEGKWFPEDGYVWIVQPPVPGDFRVKWTPGRFSTLHAHIITATREQHWLPERGFKWVNDPPAQGDFRVQAQGAQVQGQELPRLHGKSLRQCHPRDHFQPDDPCWLVGSSGIYVASKFGTSSSATFAHWPDVDEELGKLDPLTENQKRAGCSISSEHLQCPGPGIGMCWAKGHDPNRDEPPMAIDVGNRGSSNFGHRELCTAFGADGLTPERAFLFDHR